MTIFTIGHSRRTSERFLALLRGAGIDALVDVRAYPVSRFSPHFNKAALEASLDAAGIAYTHLAALGGRRPPSLDPSPNGLWREEAFRNYADYALSERFRDGLNAVRALAATHAVAVMCAEADWRNCHRRIVADYLLAAGDDVRHVMETGLEPATLTPEAQPRRDGTVLYPAAEPRLL